MLRVAAGSGGGAPGTTVYVDLNTDIPGTSFIAVMTMLEDAITIMRFLDMMRFPLYPTSKAEHPWAQLLFGHLRIGKPNQHVLIKNVLPSSASWKPFLN